jgi:hypothetical protein
VPRQRFAAPDFLFLSLAFPLIGLCSYIHVSALKLSSDQRMLAFTADTTGDEAYSCWCRDLLTGEYFSFDSLRSVVSIEWGRSNSPWGLYFTVPDQKGRPHVVAWTVLDVDEHDGKVQEQSSPQLLFEEEDPAFFLDVSRTKDHRFVTISSSSKVSSEIWVVDQQQHTMDATSPSPSPLPPAVPVPVLLAPRSPGVEYFLDHGDDAFFVITNATLAKGSDRTSRQDGCTGMGSRDDPSEPNGRNRNYQLVCCPTERALHQTMVAQEVVDNDGAGSTLGQGSGQGSYGEGDGWDGWDGWEVVVRSEPSVCIEDMDLLASHLCLYERAHGQQRLRIFQRNPHRNSIGNGRDGGGGWLLGEGEVVELPSLPVRPTAASDSAPDSASDSNFWQHPIDQEGGGAAQRVYSLMPGINADYHASRYR